MGKNNQQSSAQMTSKQNRYALRKLSIGVASVMVGMVFVGGQQLAHAATTPAGASTPSAQVKPDQPTGQPAGTTGNQAGQGQGTTTPAPNQDTKAPEQGNKQDAQQTVNDWMPTPALDDLKNFEGTPENHVTKTDVADVVNQVNTLKQEEYQKQLDQAKKQVLAEVNDYLDHATPEQIQAIKDEQNLAKLQDLLQQIQKSQDDQIQQKYLAELDAAKQEGYKNIDNSHTPEAIQEAVDNAARAGKLITLKVHLMSIEGHLSCAAYVLDGYQYLPADQKAALVQDILNKQKLLEKQRAELAHPDDIEDIYLFDGQVEVAKYNAEKLLQKVQGLAPTNLANEQAAAADALAKLPNLNTASPFAPAVLTAFQKEVKDAKDTDTIDILMSMAEQMNLPIPQAPAQPEQPEQPQAPSEHQDPEAPVAGKTGMSKGTTATTPAGPTMTKLATKVATPAPAEKAAEHQLPQTGDQHSGVALAGLGLMGIAIGMFGLQKKRG